MIYVKRNFSEIESENNFNYFVFVIYTCDYYEYTCIILYQMCLKANIEHGEIEMHTD